MGLPQAKGLLTPTEYLAIERQASYRSEWIPHYFARLPQNRTLCPESWQYVDSHGQIGPRTVAGIDFDPGLVVDFGPLRQIGVSRQV